MFQFPSQSYSGSLLLTLVQELMYILQYFHNRHHIRFRFVYISASRWIFH